MTFKESFWSFYRGWCERGGPILLAVCFLGILAFAWMQKDAVASVCGNTCAQLGGTKWDTGSLGLECYCNANLTTLQASKQACANQLFNASTQSKT